MSTSPKRAAEEDQKDVKTNKKPKITPLTKQTAFDLNPNAAAAAAAAVAVAAVAEEKPVWVDEQYKVCADECGVKWHGGGYDQKGSILEVVFIKAVGPGGDACEMILKTAYPNITVIRVIGDLSGLSMTPAQIAMGTGKAVACVNFMPDHESLTALHNIAKSMWLVNHFPEGNRLYVEWSKTMTASTWTNCRLSEGEWSSTAMVFTAVTRPQKEMPWWLILVDKHEVRPHCMTEKEKVQWLALTVGQTPMSMKEAIERGSDAAEAGGLKIRVEHLKRQCQLLIRSLARPTDWIKVNGTPLIKVRYVKLTLADDWQHITAMPQTAREVMEPEHYTNVYAMYQFDEKKNVTNFSLRNGIDHLGYDLMSLSKHWGVKGGLKGAVRITVPGRVDRIPDPNPPVAAAAAAYDSPGDSP